MRIWKVYILHPVFLFIFSSAQAQEDHVLHARDSVLEKECYQRYFEMADQVLHPEKITVVTKSGRVQKLPAFKKSIDTGNRSIACLSDLDNDGKQELLVWNYTGGAHCCDEFYIFKNTGPDKYQFAAKIFSGNVCMAENHSIFFDFYEYFGYFYTCFTCAYTDTSESAPIPVHNIELRYEKGRLRVIPGEKDFRTVITDNLEKLGEQSYRPLPNETDHDNGLRKEFALNLAVYYYTFGKNLTATKRLFDKYYRFPDAAKVWTSFTRVLNNIKRENSF
jgi:hypothetical protein